MQFFKNKELIHSVPVGSLDYTGFVSTSEQVVFTLKSTSSPVSKNSS